jgi:ABC-2 type transport system permease protein
MTYGVSLFRAITLERLHLSPAQLLQEELAFQVGNVIITPLGSILILSVFGLIFLFLSTMSFVRLDFSRINRNKNDSIDF